MRRVGSCAWVALLAACGTTTDDRPRTLEHVTEAILQPTCGAAQCHSTFVQKAGYVFDTIDGARDTFRRDVENQHFHLLGPDLGDPPLLYTFSATAGDKRMPYDAPMPDADVALIKDWIGLGAPGTCVAEAAFCYADTFIASCSGDAAYTFTECGLNERCAPMATAVCVCPSMLRDPTGSCCVMPQQDPTTKECCLKGQDSTTKQCCMNGQGPNGTCTP